MIVRILSEGQYRLDDAGFAYINLLDEKLSQSIQADDVGAYEAVLAEVVGFVRSGTRVEADTTSESDLVLPPADTTLSEAKRLLS